MAKPKLNQIVAVVSGKKSRCEKEFGELNKIIQKPELFMGISRQYSPLREDGESLPPESKIPQKSIMGIITQVEELLTGIINAVATQEYGNCGAKADIVVDGTIIVPEVPVTVLLYLEKQLNDIYTFVGNLPTYDPTEQWEWNENESAYKTRPTQTMRTKKEQKVVVLYQATDKHPAQVQLVGEDITAGHWTTVKSTTVLSPANRIGMLQRIEKLQDAVKVAREEANSIEIDQQHVAAPILKYIFGN